jgi:predicted P-loop ATPase
MNMTASPSVLDDRRHNLASSPVDFAADRKAAFNLLFSWGLSPVPVAPAFPIEQYATKEGKQQFTGKNPSYLKNGIPQWLNHAGYQNQQPTQEEVNDWFSDPRTGIGCLGTASATTGGTVAIDLDTKQFPGSHAERQAACDAAYEKLLTDSPILKSAWLERTHSGGYRIILTMTGPKSFTNFALTPSGNHVGEALGAGRFTVLAPTIGPSGTPYVNLHRPERLPEIASLESIGIHSCAKTKKTKPKTAKTPKATPSSPQAAPSYAGELTGVVPLDSVVSRTVRDILGGVNTTGDRSKDLIKVALELWGWENWLAANGIGCDGSDLLINVYAAGVGYAVDDLARKLATIDRATALPSCAVAGNTSSPWQKLTPFRFRALLLEGLKPEANKAAIEAAITFDAVIAAIVKADLTEAIDWQQRALDFIAMHLTKAQTSAAMQATGFDDEALQHRAEVCLHRLRQDAATNGDDIGDVMGTHSGDAVWTALKSKPAALVDFVNLSRKFGDRLRYDTLKMACEMDGKAIDLDKVLSEFVTKYAFDPKAKAESSFLPTVVSVCQRHSYNPIEEYLDRVKATHGGDTSILDGIASRYFGNNTAIAQAFIIKTLIAAVARVRKPGCKVDTVLVLQGDQGWCKSTFFETLSRGWFDDAMGDVGNKDEILKAQSAWFVEWGELNHITGKKGIEKTKAFLTSRVDRIRPPYGRITLEMPRSFIIVGSSNPKEILHDETGNRRFWPLAVTKKIDLVMLESEVDQIWAAAVALYESAAEWWLTDEEELLAAANNEEFKSEDVWQATIEEWLSHPFNLEGVDGDCAQVNRILSECLRIDPGHQDRLAQTRATKCLRQLGWEVLKNPIRVAGKQVRVWRRVSEPIEAVTHAKPDPSPAAPMSAHVPTGDWGLPVAVGMTDATRMGVPA